jgi:hypothetical protein
MMLMFQLQRPDVLPVDDFGVRMGFRLAYGLKGMPKPKALAKFGERWAPIAASRPGICGAQWICPNRICCQSANVRLGSRCNRCQRRRRQKRRRRPVRKPYRNRARAPRASAARESALLAMTLVTLLVTDACSESRPTVPPAAAPTAAPPAGTLQSGRHAIGGRRQSAGRQGRSGYPACWRLGRGCRGRRAGCVGPGGAAEFRPGRRRVHQLLRCAQSSSHCLQRPRNRADRRDTAALSGPVGQAAAVLCTAVLSGRSTGVPGAIAALNLLQQEHGKLRWRHLFGAAQALAINGFTVSPRLQYMINSRAPQASAPDAVRYFSKSDGSRYVAGDVLRNPAYAASLQRIADHGAEGLLSGPIARDIVAIGCMRGICQERCHCRTWRTTDRSKHRPYATTGNNTRCAPHRRRPAA